MNEQDKYLFDLQGYLVLKGVLDADRLKGMQADLDAQGIQPPDDQSIGYRFSNFLHWGKPWRDLIDQEPVFSALQEILGPKFRLDHAYGMAQRSETSKGNLHHHAGMFHHGCYHVTHGQTMHNGLVVVSYALTDVPPGAGGFCCIPGSHKAIYPMPGEWFKDPTQHPALKHVPMNAGDVLIFSEALTHGTLPWTHEGGERRSVLLKYCPLYMRWAQKTMSDDIEGLTERQRAIMRGPYVSERDPIPA